VNYVLCLLCTYRALAPWYHISFHTLTILPTLHKGHTTVEWIWWCHHRNANRVFGYLSVILAPFGTVFGYFWLKKSGKWQPWFSLLPVPFRVANLAFFKPDFEILAFFERLRLFLGNQKSQTKSFFFSIWKAWIWQNIVWAAYSLQISSDESLTMQMQGVKNIAMILLFP